MTLIILLCALGIEYYLIVLDDLRCLTWFSRYSAWLQGKLGQFNYWNGTIGVVTTLAVPLLLLLVVDYGLKSIFLPLSYLFALFIFASSIGPIFLNRSLNAYVDALNDGDDVESSRYAEMFYGSKKKSKLKQHDQAIVESIFVKANEGLYAVIFWFVVLGPFGAMLYRLTNILKYQIDNKDSAYIDTVRRLSNILDWPVVHLSIVGHALAGHMLDTISAWAANKNMSFMSIETVLRSASLGALHYSSTDELDRVYWIKATQSLINRTLIVWLVVLAVGTIGGLMT